jgi:hypothetical protein
MLGAIIANNNLNKINVELWLQKKYMNPNATIV